MSDRQIPVPNRLERQKQRTRAALLRAAQEFIAAGKLNAPILEITQAADIGMGSFYNHFGSKEELFAAAVADVLDAQGELLDRLTESLSDPAERFACRYRLCGRLFRLQPQESRIMLSIGVSLLSSDRGLAPRAKRDIVAASEAGRFQVDDPDIALAIAGGALLGLGQLLLDQPDRDDAQTADDVTRDVLRMFGVTAKRAERLTTQALPDLTSGNDAGSAA
ncbi:TetR/AcrR family transcriptional regulator [Mycolicibacterium fluoranthenivorans]|uniref:AcrR family transcriptional regulator n=1 Tax=Mycolicibacterium fluoranthenivorans TaxID=258505 RepID=A0A7X5ZGB5_9MYCO|nr:TetR/AcrR family transcriptional regulator [Mycolicibacterium fluoranthenivorans]MCV7356524.1 TetR/AcrR family transcriptional regulator [Mycolicibacterium fluoranthenivorans]NIH99086.1 AcrR family transcriptional regulator [Mycolicibacterium fluoranthenivorans]